MSCDTCKYKVVLDGYEEDEGGARAMLRALTHQQAHEDRDDVADEPHAHDAPETHSAVCTNQTCAADGSPAALENLRQAARDAERSLARLTDAGESFPDDLGDSNHTLHEVFPVEE